MGINENDEIQRGIEGLRRQYLKGEMAHFAEVAEDFIGASFDYFSNNYNDFEACDGYFNLFTIIWQPLLQQEDYGRAKHIWRYGLNLAASWEEENGELLHKGTPYYFLGMTCILDGNLEEGFLYMHQALEEDKRTRGTDDPDTPARHLVLLDPDQPQQAFILEVQRLAGFLREYLNNYRSVRGKSLTLDGFRSKLLESTELRETAFYTVYALSNLSQIKQTNVTLNSERVRENPFASLLDMERLFPFCLIIENVLSNKLKDQDSLCVFLQELADEGDELINCEELKSIKEQLDSDFEDVFTEILQGNYTNNVRGRGIDGLEADMALTYFLRNSGAHEIESRELLSRHFDELSSRVLNTLFFSLEVLY